MKETKFNETDNGQLPEDWKNISLSDIFDFGNGYTPSKHNSTFWSNGIIPWFRIEDIREKGHILSDSLQHITSLAVKGDLFPKDSFIISTSATIGEYAYVTKPYLANQRFVCLIKKDKEKSRINDRYFLCICDSLGQWCRDNCDQGSSFASVNMSLFRAHKVALPPINEQCRIAKALSDVDGLLTSLDKLIEKKRNIKIATMQQLLTGKTRLKGFIGPWIEKNLGEMLDYEQPTKYLVKTVKYSDYGIPVLTAGKTGILGFTNESFGVYTNVPVIIFDDFTTDSRYIPFPFKIKSSAIKMLSAQNDYDLRFIFELLKINKYIPGDHQRHWISIFSNFSIQIPSNKREQSAIANILLAMDLEIQALEKKRAKYEAIKKGMMQQLLTGKIRLI